jgi:hypothetical protein
MSELDRVQLEAFREAQAQIRQSREQLINTGLALRAQLHEVFEWRAWYRRNPAIWLGGAFVLGWFVGRRPM